MVMRSIRPCLDQNGSRWNVFSSVIPRYGEKSTKSCGNGDERKEIFLFFSLVVSAFDKHPSYIITLVQTLQ